MGRLAAWAWGWALAATPLAASAMPIESAPAAASSLDGPGSELAARLHARRLGLVLPALEMGPTLVEIATFVGDLRLEFFSLRKLEFHGEIASAFELALPEAAPAAIFDRTDLVMQVVVAVPVLAF